MKCPHDYFTVLHAYHVIDAKEHTMICTDPEEEIGPDLMKLARIVKGRCINCNTVFLAKIFKVEDICERKGN